MPDTPTAEADEIIDAEVLTTIAYVRELLGPRGQLVELHDESGTVAGRVARMFLEGEVLRWVEIDQGEGDLVRVRWSTVSRIVPIAEDA